MAPARAPWQGCWQHAWASPPCSAPTTSATCCAALLTRTRTRCCGRLPIRCEAQPQREHVSNSIMAQMQCSSLDFSMDCQVPKEEQPLSWSWVGRTGGGWGGGAEVQGEGVWWVSGIRFAHQLMCHTTTSGSHCVRDAEIREGRMLILLYSRISCKL